MDCPHLANRLKTSSFLRRIPSQFECSVCKSKKSPWLCVHCGLVLCGRYENGHAKAHAKEMPDHMVTMDCASYSVFCYSCDDYVINDTRSRDLHQLKAKLEGHENCTRRGVKNQEQESIQAQGSTASNRRARKACSRSTNGSNSIALKSRAIVKKDCKANIAGLRNLGNTCFMNAVLQSLSNIQQFSGYFKKLPSLEHSRSKALAKRENGTGNEENKLLAEELRKTLLMLWSGSKGGSGKAISPESLFAVIWKVVPRFRGYQQQDAHEFLRYMLDRLHTELLGILPYPDDKRQLDLFGKSTVVTGIFGGLLQNEVTCLACGNESKKHDPFLDLSLDLPDDCSNRSTDSGGNSNDTTSTNNDRCHLLDCLSSFIRLEELEDSELYLCPTCKKKQKSTKRFWIRRLPNVLCLHLKRFRWNNYLRTKLDTFVEYPLKGLDMSHYVLSNKHETRRSACGGTLYDLAAVIVHHGSGLGSGHYTAYATHGGCWHHFNDSNVTVCEEDTVASSNAYILFYIRRELNLTPLSF